jgi:hypothetical protein
MHGRGGFFREAVQFFQIISEIVLELSWTGSKSVAVGNECYIKDIQQKLTGRVRGRSVISHNGTTAFKKPLAYYNALFDNQKSLLSLKNTYFLPI